MNNFYSIDKETLEKFVGVGTIKTLSEIEDAREEYFNSDLFIKNRRNLLVSPFKFGLPRKKLRLLSETDLVVKQMMYDFNKSVWDMPKHLHNEFEMMYLEKAKVFPPPVDIYISHSEASQIFGVSEKRLHISRKIGMIKFIKHEGEYAYQWSHLQAFFG